MPFAHRMSYRKIIVNVTEEHITKGTPRDSARCAVKLAIADAVPGSTAPWVDTQSIRFSVPAEGVRYIYFTPTKIQHYIIEWDEGLPIMPFTFQLNAGQVVRMITSKPRENRAGDKLPTKATLVKNPHTKRYEKHGGKTPPLVPFSRRRQWGLRALRNKLENPSS